VKKIEFGQGMLQIRRIFPVSIILLTSLLINMSMLLLSEGEAGVAYKPANKAALFRCREILAGQVLSQS